MTKVDIFSGFLGAGKTTLIKKLIAEAYAGEQLVLIENEFGEIGIDGGFMQEAGIRVNELNSGCICCSLVGDFAAALQQVVAEYDPDRILIEPSGVGKLSDIIRAVADVDGMQVNAAVAVADGGKAKMYMKNFGEFYDDQIRHAGAIVLSRTQKLTQEKLDAAIALLREVNPEAAIITTPWDALDGKQILAAIEHTDSLAQALAELTAHHEHHHHHEHECHDPDCDCHEHAHHHHHEHECHDPDCDCHEHEHHHHHEHECHDPDCDCHEHEHHHHHEHECHDPDCGCHEHKHHHHHEHECHDPDCGCHEHEHHHHHEHECHDPDCDCHEHHHGHHADEVFVSWGVETAKKFSEAELHGILAALDDTAAYGTVLRAKGIVDSSDGAWLHFDHVPGEAELRRGGAGVTGRVCVIGSGLNKDALSALFGV